MGAASSAGMRARSCAGLVRLELAHEVGDVLGVDLVEQLADLLRILLQDLLDVGAEESADAHGDRLDVAASSRCRPGTREIGDALRRAETSLIRDASTSAMPHPGASFSGPAPAAEERSGQ